VTGVYKTGDRHPEHNMLAFVRYDQEGREEWTSVYRDPTAPFRLAAESESNETGGKCCPDGKGHIESARLAVERQ
jgi:hypothetical protein